MKKTFLVLSIALASVATVNAQVLTWGVKAGFNTSTISNGGIPGATSNPYKPGFQLGGVAQYMLTPQFGLESGLYFSQIGNKSEIASITQTSNPSYLQLPVTALYKFNVGTDLYLYPQAGLYLGYGLGGKYKTTVSTEKFFGTGTNRFDAGLTCGLNLQYTNYVIGLGYDLGLLKINKHSVSGVKDQKNANIKVTLGYFF
ncbi:MAG: PorT family protein [Dysgonamonadaceae bacterium]|jgi:predicted porin|nr:PorT family protein [Dysgonamonadaceae bacterium]